MRITRLLPLGGIAFVALVVFSIGLGGASPDLDAPAQEVVSFYEDNLGRVRLSALVLAASIPFLLFFASSLAGFRCPGDSDSRAAWRRVFLAGSVIAAATIAIGVLTHLALANGADDGVAPEALQTLNVLDSHVVYALVASFGVMMLGAAGWLLGRERIFGRLGWIALALGVALFIPFLGVLALLLSAVWVVVASVALFSEIGTPGPTSGTVDDLAEG
jgi:hypothetical protein